MSKPNPYDPDSWPTQCPECGKMLIYNEGQAECEDEECSFDPEDPQWQYDDGGCDRDHEKRNEGKYLK